MQRMGHWNCSSTFRCDLDAMHVRLADEKVLVLSVQKGYLNVSSIMSAVDLTGAEAIHPGYIFI